MSRRKQNQSQVYQSLAMITQFGITMLVPIGLCSFLGWYLDGKLGTDYLFVVLFFIGALAGFRNIFILSRKVYEGREDAKDDYVSTINRLAKAGNEKSSKDNQTHISKKGDGGNA